LVAAPITRDAWNASPMGVFVIVHGAWGGGWEWSPVAQLLRERDHEVFTPTLTGMGERAHLGREEHVGLATHIADLVAVMEFENLRDVVLCGASYGGMPATGAADRMGDRIGLVVYVDALVPRHGQSALDLLPAPFGEAVRAGVKEHGPGWRIPMPEPLLTALLPAGSLPEDVRVDYLTRLRDHPAATFLDPVSLTGAVEHLRRAFIRCTMGDFTEEVGGDPIEACAARARSEGWIYRELSAPHDPQLFNPLATAELLHELAAGAPSTAPAG
jgi:pimeloyl-ACP methyl ester carboxylesterase